MKQKQPRKSQRPVSDPQGLRPGRSAVEAPWTNIVRASDARVGARQASAGCQIGVSREQGCRNLSGWVTDQSLAKAKLGPTVSIRTRKMLQNEKATHF